MDGFINILERVGGDNRMFITAHNFAPGSSASLLAGHITSRQTLIVDIEEIIDVVNPVEFFVSVKAQELIHAEPFFNLERNVARLIQPIRMCHFQSLLIFVFVLLTTTIPSSGVVLINSRISP
jgi:hypothetical protein